MKTIEWFLNKETQINISISKVESKLEWFKQNKDSLPVEVIETWNDWHDLHDRLQDRLQDNYCRCGSWKFQKYGFTVI